MRRSLRRCVPVLLVSFMAAVMAGCGSEATPEDAGAAREEALLAVAQCMRDEGVDVPDPEPGERGLSFTQVRQGQNPEEVAAAREKCRDELEGTAGEAEEEEFDWQDRLVEYAACMRSEGIDMPDPDPSQADAGPGAYIRQHARGSGPAFESADDTCREKVFGGPDSGPGGGDETG